ncbi:MAG: hemolysin [Pseudopedobacter saltans]|uniref:Hemolysin n=1 Tax=Pseudopedobacter saltans TaxID=151895 RepID=A0A2W5F064_9SPHI|nr:MAG: hemolysin [Pseudopedobacter saltans]
MEIFIILALILLNGFFSLAEISLISSRKVRLEAQAHKGDKKAKKALGLINKPDVFLSTVQIGITLVGILTGIFSGDNIKKDFAEVLNRVDFFRPYSQSIATITIVFVIMYLSLVLGELVPKRIGLTNPEKTAKIVTAPMQFIIAITKPFIWLLNKSSEVIIRILGIKEGDNQISEEEIKAIINEGTEQGTIEQAEQQIITRVFSLGDRTITSMMTHRSDVVWLDVNTSIDEVKEDFELHSVYPVCEKNIDQIKGVVFIKDLFAAPAGTLVGAIAKPVMYVPENITAYHLLEKFKKSKIHYAIIVDEYGTLQGIITLHDILEAIVGEMAEADDTDIEIFKREDGSYIVDGQMPFYDFLSYLHIEWSDEEKENNEEYDTLAGFILHNLEHIPVVGEKLVWKDFTFEILDLDGHRIDKVLATRKPKSKEQDIDGDA